MPRKILFTPDLIHAFLTKFEDISRKRCHFKNKHRAFQRII